jgi:GNAT superfamily N-acetyltransferase
MTIVRPTTFEDDYRIEDLRVATWRVAYAHLIPADYFDGWDYDAVIASRQGGRTNDVVAYVAEESDGALSGFSFGGPSRDEGCEGAGEVYSLYVAPRFWGGGQGNLLMQRTLHDLASYTDTYLWVLRDNPRARRFYERWGFEPDGTEQMCSLPKRLALPEVRYRLRK